MVKIEVVHRGKVMQYTPQKLRRLFNHYAAYDHVIAKQLPTHETHIFTKRRRKLFFDVRVVK